MKKTVLLLGSGGKEHAWALAIKESDAEIISWAPKINPGVAELSIGIIEAGYEKNRDLIEPWIECIDLVIIGQCQPMLDGIGDWFEELGKKVFSPSAKNAMIEGSKVYLREFLHRNNIDGNINFTVCTSKQNIQNAFDKTLELAIKPDGLTGGDGVRVFGDHFKSKDEATVYATKLLQQDGIVLLEQLITGIEFSLQGFAAGNRVVFLPLVKDYKRAYDGNKGPNTGSMGACSFANHGLPYLSYDDYENAKKIICEVLEALERENGPYNGAIYGQFMVTADGLKIIEFNARLGDPEAINTLGLLKTPLLDIIDILSDVSQKVDQIQFEHKATCVLYLVPKGFPEHAKEGVLFDIPDTFKDNWRLAYVNRVGEKFETTKKRSLILIEYGKTLAEARQNVYKLIPVGFDDLSYRTDIAVEFT
ncbi:MAG: phosphoribosylamine--glycine ligase [Candidatus Heimdallarchaeota archaeon]|nr:phosphoribosylamine--glycine ligase [Candidatus Heimdallarchaeota archaeon]